MVPIIVKSIPEKTELSTANEFPEFSVRLVTRHVELETVQLPESGAA